MRCNLNRALHTAEFIKIFLKVDVLFINVDEVLFTIKTKQEYSYLRRWRCRKVKNILFTVSKSLTVAVSLSGDWFATYLTWNIHSDVFISFMKRLMLWMVIDLKDTFIIINNIKVHSSESTMKLLRKCDALFSFIPKYTQEIVLIELFLNILKKWLIKENLKMDWNYSRRKHSRRLGKHSHLSIEWKYKVAFSTFFKL